MINYLDKVLYLYPNIQRIMYWHTQADGTPWNDLYDGLVWENTDIAKPSKEALDALDDNTVATELASRKEVQRKADRDAQYAKDLSMVANYNTYLTNNPGVTFSQYLDYLESLTV